MSFRSHAVGAVCALALVTAACGGSSQPGNAASGDTAPAAATANLPEAPSGEGTITGRIKYEGTAPKPQTVRMASDPLCMPTGTVLSEVLMVGADGGLQNVFVHVKDAFNGQTFRPPTTPVVLDQDGCQYTPHVFGVQVGQPVAIRNSDATLHNVHTTPKTNEEFNFAQTKQGMETARSFDKPEIMVPFRCDVHGWMNAYGGVVPHPFFAVSGTDGTFEIRGLPAGTYTVEAWHEQLGMQTMTVTSDGKSAATADFAFKART